MRSSVTITGSLEDAFKEWTETTARRLEHKPLSQSIADVAGAVERQAIAEGCADASRFVRPLMRDLPDGHIAVGALDGFTAVIPKPMEG